MKRAHEDGVDLNGSQRILSGTVGALCTAFLVTPFDVIKVRLQAQLGQSVQPHPHQFTFGHVHNAETPTCSHYRLQTGLMDVWCRKCDLPSASPRFSNSIDAVVKIVRLEGIGSLWRGLASTLIMSVPNNAVYYALYDVLHARFREEAGSFTAPLLAAVLARFVTVSSVSPFELIRTKQQAGSTIGAWKIAKSEISQPGGILRLWRGLPPTLLRDLPFSAVYWSILEPLRASIEMSTWVSPDVKKARIEATFFSGAIAGSIAAILTHPFDLIKTRRQIQLYELDPARQGLHEATTVPSSSISIIRTVIKEEGFFRLYSGLGARLGKIAPACAIMISAYEFSKQHFETST